MNQQIAKIDGWYKLHTRFWRKKGCKPRLRLPDYDTGELVRVITNRLNGRVTIQNYGSRVEGKPWFVLLTTKPMEPLDHVTGYGDSLNAALIAAIIESTK